MARRKTKRGAIRNRSLSTGDLAHFCQVTPATIVNWIRAGKLNVYTTPGGQYRMELEKFVDFLKQTGFPVPEELRGSDTRHVMIIDSDLDVAEELAAIVENMGPHFSPRAADNGYDALMLIGQATPHLLVVDMKLPKMDTLELCRRLRANPETAGMRIVALSASSASTELTRGMKNAGIDAMVRKPVDATKFADTVRGVLAGKSR